MPKKAGVRVTIDKVGAVSKAVLQLADQRVMVGIPSDKDLRSGGEITNAALLYIHTYGAPEVGIPARDAIHPTIKDKQKTLIEPALKAAGAAAFSGRPEGILREYARIGQGVADAIRARIVAGVPPPLKEATILARARRGAAYQKASPGRRKILRDRAIAASATPLIDTAQMLRSITWVIRKR